MQNQNSEEKEGREFVNKQKNQYKVLFVRQEDHDGLINIGYWLSEGFDPEFRKFTKEINEIVEPQLISVEDDAEKIIKYRAILHKCSKINHVAPPCMMDRKVVEVVINKTATENRIQIRKVWKKYDITKFSSSLRPIEEKPTYQPRLVKEAAKKWKKVEVEPAKQVFGTFGDRILKQTAEKMATLLVNGCPMEVDAEIIANELSAKQ